MKLGLDHFLEKKVHLLNGKRIGLVTNMTGVNARLQPTIDLFYEHPAIHLTALFGPEHGIRGDAKEGEKVVSSTDPYTKLPVYSLYGETRRPTKEMMDSIDVVVFDLQDIGSRYYTYIYTMAYMMEACAAYGKHFIVLDRPNPIAGNVMEGNLVKEELRSFVGLYPIPNRHGLTVGELAFLFKHEFHIACELTVIPMIGWKRSMYLEETNLLWVPPSPNTTSIDMTLLYTGTCLIEGTNLSEGRGTAHPFEYIGAPFIDGYYLAKKFNEKKLSGVLARPTSFKPTYQKYNGEICQGVQLHVENRKTYQSLKTGLMLIETIAEMYPDYLEFPMDKKQNRSFFDLISGDKEVRNKIVEGRVNEFMEACESELEQFKKQVKPYLLYGE
ncbi:MULTISPECIES: exo-beta-N-acetylmuramidase NamZ family protein [unclassified Bacillus (in: firmicutes)]|uniref:exo-beta-N-acetylmuramidase NamZ family protein n=1 Tax=unclassified Bacillus (in: firmicutes) TaxID=185979 RepID=UPI0004E0B4DD|nr:MULTISPECIES: DUF1343 domain-containing protein [unclassified Bacillus (in: firmicutes)]